MGRFLVVDNGNTRPPVAPAIPAKHHISQGLAKSLTITFVTIFSITASYLLLNLICRCIRRYGESTHNENVNGSRTEEEKECIQQLETIPVLVYAKSPKEEAVIVEAGIVPEPEICSICLAEYEEREMYRLLPGCSHMFHKECIDRWLLSRSSFCPICRSRVIQRTKEPLRCNCGRERGEGENQVNNSDA